MRSLLLVLVAVGSAFSSKIATAQSEPNVFIAGIWPDRIIFFDQTTDEFTEGLRLRHGAVTDGTSTHDKRKFFLVTDRMESVEVVDVVRREVIDEFKLSSGEQRIRIFGAYPNANGTKAYLTVNVMRLLTDRYVQENDYDIVLYDLERHEVVDRFSLPPEVEGRGYRPSLFVPEDDSEFYVLGSDIYIMDAATHEVKDKLALSKPLWSGYGGFRGVNLHEAEESGVFWGIYRTQDPVQEKNLFGLTKIDVPHKKVETFELGPALRVGRGLAFSPDKKRVYAGISDMVIVDMETKRVLRHKEGFERGRANNSLIVSHDGTKLYVSGVGDTVWIYDAETLELIKTVYAGGDFMLPPVEVPNPRNTAGN